MICYRLRTSRRGRTAWVYLWAAWLDSFSIRGWDVWLPNSSYRYLWVERDVSLIDADCKRRRNFIEVLGEIEGAHFDEYCLAISVIAFEFADKLLYGFDCRSAWLSVNAISRVFEVELSQFDSLLILLQVIIVAGPLIFQHLLHDSKNSKRINNDI